MRRFTPMINRELIPYERRGKPWITAYENPSNYNVYKGIQGYVRDHDYTPDLASYIKTFGMYNDRKFHMFYLGEKYFLPTEIYMTKEEIVNILWGHMSFHYIWHDDLGFDFSL